MINQSGCMIKQYRLIHKMYLIITRKYAQNDFIRVSTKTNTII